MLAIALFSLFTDFMWKKKHFNYNFDLGPQTIPEANYLWVDKMMTSHIKISYDCESERNFLDKTLKLQAG